MPQRSETNPHGLSRVPRCMRPLPDGYETMIRRARRALYEGELRDRYERRLAARMVAEGWLVSESAAWSGERVYRATEKALNRV